MKDTIKVCSNLLPNRFKPDTYSTYEPDYETIEDEELAGGKFDLSIYVTKVAEYIENVLIEDINPELPPFIQFTKIDDLDAAYPRAYNFRTDSCFYMVEYDRQKILDDLRSKKEDVDKFTQKFESRPGFISMMPTSYQRLISTDDEERFISVVISYYTKDIDLIVSEDFNNNENTYLSIEPKEEEDYTELNKREQNAE